MKISTKGRYALRMLVDLAEQSDGQFVSLKDIAARQQLSKKYLEQIAPILTRGGMLKTNRGFQGGYKLAKPAEQVRVGDILRLTEGSLAPVACLEQSPNPCERCSTCTTLFVWEGLGKIIAEYLDGITLRDIVDRQHSVWDFSI